MADKPIELEVLPPKKSETRGVAGQVLPGLKESIPFVSPEKAEGPAPRTFGEKFTRRFARNLPLDVGIGAIGGPPGMLLGTGAAAGSALAGTAAEELGLGKGWQTAAEIGGGGAPVLGRKVLGKVGGFIEPQLEQAYSKGKQYFEFGPGARTQKGMKYGTGETEEAAIRNLNKFTEEATRRAGSATNNINAGWIKETGNKLGKEVTDIFKGKRFSSDANFSTELNRIVNDSKGAFADAPNTIENIIESNIKGTRPRGELISGNFAAEDLRKAIVEINQRLSSADGPKAHYLGQLKDSLENLAGRNLQQYGPELAQRYNTWRSQYSSFSTIKDAYMREGKLGVTSSGQLNPEKLLDVIGQRTGGYAARNPLYEGLGEFGTVMRYKTFPEKGAIKSTVETLTESPLSKALQTTLQPRVLSRAGARASGVLPFTPALLQSTTRDNRITPEDIEVVSKVK